MVSGTRCQRGELCCVTSVYFMRRRSQARNICPMMRLRLPRARRRLYVLRSGEMELDRRDSPMTFQGMLQRRICPFTSGLQFRNLAHRMVPMTLRSTMLMMRRKMAVCHCPVVAGSSMGRRSFRPIGV